MAHGYGKNNAGDNKKSAVYRVVYEEKENLSPPPTHITVYYLEHIQSGKKLERSYLSLEEAETACDFENKNNSPP